MFNALKDALRGGEEAFGGDMDDEGEGEGEGDFDDDTGDDEEW